MNKYEAKSARQRDDEKLTDKPPHRPTLIFLICVAEKASRPFDLPYITARYSRPPSVVTCRVSALMAAMASMPEVTAEDSISRRGSAVSLPRSQGNNIHGQRPNSHTTHAAAIAASNATSTAVTGAAAAGGHMGGPRAPPASSRSWSFSRYDDRTKRQLADSVSDASQASDARPRLGGPRPLAASDIAVKTGVLPPPVCTEPREARLQLQPQQEQQLQQQHQQQQHQQQSYQPYSTDPEKAGAQESGGGGGAGWKSDWWALRTVAGWVSPAGSGATTPVSTPGVGPGPGPVGGGGGRSRAARLSTVAEDWVPAGGISGGASSDGGGGGVYYHDTPSPPTRPPLLRGSRDNGYHHDVHAVDRAAIPTPPPPSAAAASAGGRPVRAPTAARVRLVRAQEALKSQARAKSGATVVLTRPVHLAGGDRRGVADEDRPARPPLQSSLSIPGSYVDE